MEFHTNYNYRTQKGNVYPVFIGFKSFPSIEVIHDYKYVVGLCKKGCKNFNKSGGCPPLAPDFAVLQSKFHYAVLLYSKFYSSSKPKKVKESTKPYIHFRFQDIILSAFLTKLGYNVLDNIKQDYIFLNNGYCMGCGNRKCSFKEGNSICRNPQKRTFSLEATGINAELTVKKLFGIDMQWYNRHNYNDVEFMTKVIGFFAYSVKTQENIFNHIMEYLLTDIKPK